ncbi:hypothetical protein J3R30DRAFT_3698283 [Lentinula aciculospora]|uniref:Uncharacterized protein n=1 Tax=Lentinula aciculospora TaxID=153920 RepID=A0A9W9DS36_9AGAR|nr:hypothetical protein J3R30DRAFT_3698283 [Lentinula aciculospora]
MPSSIRRAFKHTKVDESSPTKSLFLPSLRGRSGSKTNKISSVELDSPSKTKRTIKTSDITYIFSEDTTNVQDFSLQPDLDDLEGCDEEGRLSRSDSPPLIIDRAFVDQFPLPPVVHAYTSPDVRIPVPSPNFGCESLEGSDSLLPPPHPRVQQYMAEQKASNRSLRRQPLARSSSVTSYSRPTATAYSALFQDNGSSTSSLPLAPSSYSVMMHHHTHREPNHSQSLSDRATHSLGANRPLLHQRSYSDMDVKRLGHRTRQRTLRSVEVPRNPAR